MEMYSNDDDELEQFMMLFAQASQLSSAEEVRRLNKKRSGTRLDAPAVPRIRKTVTQVYRELGKHYFRRAFRMSYSTFGRLYRLLENDLKRETGTKRFESDYVERSTNGPILLTVRLASAIRFFAGGEAYDIAVMFGISHTSVFDSVAFVVNAINKCKEMNISFPTDHARQRENARGFRSKSDVGFDRVVGCIDGIVIWTHKPTKEDCKDAGVDETKLFVDANTSLV